MSQPIFFRYALQFYKDGVIHVPEMNETFTTLTEDGIEEYFSGFIGKYYKIKLCIPTTCFVYEGFRIPKTNENQHHFRTLSGEVEKILGCEILEIWRYSYSEQDLPIPNHWKQTGNIAINNPDSRG